MEISGKGLLYFYQQALPLIGNQTYHRTNMCLPYQPNSRYESDYECICIVINGKKHSVPLNIMSSVVTLFILDTSKRVLWQIVKTQRAKIKKAIFRGRNTSFFFNFERQPLQIQNGQFHIYY